MVELFSSFTFCFCLLLPTRMLLLFCASTAKTLNLQAPSILYVGQAFRYSPESAFFYTELFISPSGISELDCATTKTDTAERSISIGRESL